MKRFKNNAQKYGYYFGIVCQTIGFVGALVCMPMVPNDYGEHIINAIPAAITLLCFSLGLYGIYRSGV